MATTKTNTLHIISTVQVSPQVHPRGPSTKTPTTSASINYQPTAAIKKNAKQTQFPDAKISATDYEKKDYVNMSVLTLRKNKPNF